jgi:nucleotide-binding universal stress UspA family protein
VFGMSRVIVGVNGSPGSIRALRYAAHLASLGDVPLTAVLAWVPPGGEVADRREPSEILRRIWRQAASKRLNEAIDLAWGGTGQNPGVERLVVRGEAGPALSGVADEAGDLLVLGARRRNALSRLWPASVSRYCLGHARCPVLILPPPVLAARHGRQFNRWRFRRRELTADHVMRELQQLEQGSRRD